MEEKELIFKRWQDAKSIRSQYTDLFRDIQDYVSPTRTINEDFEEDTYGNRQRDVYINDPTAYMASTQAADYLHGILWGNGQKAFRLVPSEDLKRLLQSPDQLDTYFNFITEQCLAQMRHSECGFSTVLKGHCLDQQTFGTSGGGCYPNKRYIEGQASNALQFKSYGVWNSCFDEGDNGKIDVIFTAHNWYLSRIIDEFAVLDDEINNELYNKLPSEIRKAHEGKEFTRKFKIIHAILPHREYSMGKKGKKGTKYKGFWLYEPSHEIFAEEYYAELPVSAGRAIKYPNEVYGGSPGSVIISTIKMLNFVAGDTIEAIEKLVKPALGLFSGALANGSKLNLSSDAVTVFNAKAGSTENPLFPVSNVGDVTGAVNILIPKGTQDVTMAFKIDQLLDMNNNTQMTAAETMQRVSIRAKSLAGFVSQQIDEFMTPMIKRVVSILGSKDIGLLGVDAKKDPESAKKSLQLGRSQEIIPEEILELQSKGKDWFDVKYNNELDQIVNSKALEGFGNFLTIYSELLNLAPELQVAVKPYEMLAFIKKVTGMDTENFMVNSTKYRQAVNSQKQMQAQTMQLQSENIKSDTMKKMAGAEKDVTQAKAAQLQS